MRRTRSLLPALALAAALAFPLLIDNPYFLSVVITAYITAIAVYGLNVLLGYTGQLSLAHAGFYGIGAYAVGILMRDHGLSFWLALPLAVLLTASLGYLVGLLALRTRGDYFAIFTLAVGVIVTIVIDRWEGLTGGTDGLIGVPGYTSVGPLSFDSLLAQYYLVLALLLLSIYAVWSLVNSLVGRTLVAVRSSESLARAVGIDAGRNKQMAFVVSVAFAGLAGGLHAPFLGYLGPSLSSTVVTFNMLLYLMLGGVASMAGPLVGTLLVMLVAQALQSFEQYQGLVFGPLLVAVIVFFPLGLVGLWRSLAARGRTAMPRAARIEAAPSSDPLLEER